MAVQDEPLSRKAYSYLFERLIKNELVPGDSINRRDIADKLGMSVAPVMQAMLQLESEEYLESVPRKGTIVKPVRIDDVKGQLIVREALECAAARYYCGKPVKDNFDTFVEIARRIDEFNDDSYERWQAEIEFHQGLVRLSGINALIREFERSFRLNIFYRINRAIGIQTGHVVNRHLELLNKLLTKDPDAAEQAIRDAIRERKQDYFT